MSRLLTPKLLLRGFEVFAVASLLGFGATLLYGNNLPAFLAALRPAALDLDPGGTGAGLDGLDRGRTSTLGGGPPCVSPALRSRG